MFVDKNREVQDFVPVCLLDKKPYYNNFTITDYCLQPHSRYFVLNQFY